MTPSKHSSGFTLLEVLVVLFIIGILLGLALLPPGQVGADRQLRTEAERLSALINLAGQEAVLSGRETGLLLFADGYRFYALAEEEEHWRPLSEDELGQVRRLPGTMRLTLTSPDLATTLTTQGRDEPENVMTGATPPSPPNRESPKPTFTVKTLSGKRKESIPQVIFYPDGELTPFALELYLPETTVRYRLTGSLGGEYGLYMVMADGKVQELRLGEELDTENAGGK